MSNRAPLIVSALVLILMAAIGAWAWPLIPDGARIAIHWDLAGNTNGYASKAVALMVSPALAVFVTALFAFFARAPSAGLLGLRIGWIAVLVLLAGVHVLIVLTALGRHLNVGGYTTFGISLMLIVIGNFLGKTRRNPYFGVRTPWALLSDLAWEKSNRAGGWLFVATGFATLGALAVLGTGIAVYVLIAGLGISILIAAAISYHHWKHDPAMQGDGVADE